jgi:hypothetical protein
MSTQDLLRIDELVSASDMCLRASSQLRLLLKRGSVVDIAALERVKWFLNEVSVGSNFLTGATGAAQLTSLEPLTWAADVQFGSKTLDADKRSSSDYDSLSKFVLGIYNTISDVLDGREFDPVQIDIAASFTRNLGRYLGSIADEKFRKPSARSMVFGERYSYR